MWNFRPTPNTKENYVCNLHPWILQNEIGKQEKMELLGNNNLENDKQTQTKKKKPQQNNKNPETNPINLSGEFRENSSGLKAKWALTFK